tara:strand:+ start:7417 stop:7869 length:453 start_codon:yes stop_codon:yes gene_type:complete
MKMKVNLFHYSFLFKLALTVFAAAVMNSNAFAETSDANKSLLDRKPIDIESRDQCQNERFELGKYIAASNSYLFSIERSQGGVLTWEEAQAIRERIDRELYWYTEYIRSILTNGDSQKCAQARVDGIEKINNILRSELGWENTNRNKQGN